MQKRAIYCRAALEGSTLKGTVVRYGDIATLPFGRERISPGAFAPIQDVILNRQHQRDKPLARTDGGLVLRDSPASLELEATLPDTTEALDALKLVRSNVLRGFSVEFVALQERLDNDVVVVERGRLVGIGLVDSPAYPQSQVEREKRMREDHNELAMQWSRLDLVFSGAI